MKKNSKKFGDFKLKNYMGEWIDLDTLVIFLEKDLNTLGSGFVALEKFKKTC